MHLQDFHKMRVVFFVTSFTFQTVKIKPLLLYITGLLLTRQENNYCKEVPNDGMQSNIRSQNSQA